MKRKSCLIEIVNCCPLKRGKQKLEDSVKENDTNMFKKSEWYNSLVEAEKSCLKEDKIKKVHYKFPDKKEMVEEYNTDTDVLIRRAWKVNNDLGGEGKWQVEVGDPIPEIISSESFGLKECNDQPILTRRNTRINLEWRIRNLPYPIDTYSISANKEDKSIIVRTTNKKYFKKLPVPELVRLNLPIEQASIQSSHKFNTLIIVYKKPPLLLEMEKAWLEELKNVKPNKDVPDDCRPS